MKTVTNRCGVLTLLLALQLLPHMASAFDLSSSLLQQPRPLWREFMKAFYGPYDHSRRCWTARREGQAYCMRPHRLDQVTSDGQKFAFFVIGGSRMDENGDLEQGHPDPGALGLVILRDTGGHLELVAKNSLFEDFGAFGTLPPEDQFEVHQIGPHATFGWTANSGWAGMGIDVEATSIFAPVGDTVKFIGRLPHHFDDRGNCSAGNAANTPCSDYTFDFAFDSQDQSGRFYPVVLTLSGSRAGVQYDQTFVVHFDPEKFRYEDIKNLPSGMEDDG
jgi:hypothetical protein